MILLNFWNWIGENAVALGAIITAVMAVLTFCSLVQNKKQTKKLQRQKVKELELARVQQAFDEVKVDGWNLYNNGICELIDDISGKFDTYDDYETYIKQIKNKICSYRDSFNKYMIVKNEHKLPDEFSKETNVITLYNDIIQQLFSLMNVVDFFKYASKEDKDKRYDYIKSIASKVSIPPMKLPNMKTGEKIELPFADYCGNFDYDFDKIKSQIIWSFNSISDAVYEKNQLLFEYIRGVWDLELQKRDEVYKELGTNPYIWR